MLCTGHPARAAARPNPATPIDMDTTLFAALELSLSSWVVVASAPGEDKAGKHGLAACDGPGLLALLERLQERAERRCGCPVAVVVMQEAGRDGFWVHRLLEAHGVQSLVVDPSSIAVNRRSRRAKTDRIDAEAMLRTLMAWSRGERQVCAMVRPPSREAEDARRLTREREALLAERIRHANRIKGLLATQGVFGFEPTRRDRRTRLTALRTPENATLAPRLLAEVGRQLDRLELTLQQLAAVEAARDAAFAAERATVPAAIAAGKAATGEKHARAAIPCGEGPGARLLRLKGVSPETASVLAGEAFFRPGARGANSARLLHGLPDSPLWVMGDRDFSSDAVQAQLWDLGAKPAIPAKPT